MVGRFKSCRWRSWAMLVVVAAIAAMLGGLRAPAGAVTAAHSAPQQALVGRGPVLDDKQSDCVTKARGAAIYSSDDDANAGCSKLFNGFTPKSPATYDTLLSCFIDGAGTKSFAEGIAIAKCQAKAAAGDPSTSCAYKPSPLTELIDQRIDGSFCRASSLGVGTDGGQYAVGNSITVCYSVPGPGTVTVTDVQSTGSTTLVSGNDDGTGDCLTGIVSPPLGQECIRAVFGGSSSQACFQVCNSLPCSGGTTTTSSTQPAAEPYFVLDLDGYGGAVWIGRKSDIGKGSIPECGPCTTVPKILATLAGPFTTSDQAVQDYCKNQTNLRGATGLRVSRVDAYGHKDLDADAAPSCSH